MCFDLKNTTNVRSDSQFDVFSDVFNNFIKSLLVKGEYYLFLTNFIVECNESKVFVVPNKDNTN